MNRCRGVNSFFERRNKRPEKGMALITVLMLLLLLTAMSVAMALMLNSDLLMVGYYSNGRNAFYAADSGLSVSRQYLTSQLKSGVLTSFATGSSPIPTTLAATALNNLATAMGNSTASATQVNSTSAIKEKFYVDSANSSVTPLSCLYRTQNPSTLVISSWTTSASNPTCPAAVTNAYDYLTTYSYNLSVVGMASGNEKAVMTDSGTLTLSVRVTTSETATTSFAGWGTFINKNDICNASLVGGTITGPQFTNGSWSFGQYSYTFTDSVSSAGAKAGYFCSDGCTNHESTATSYACGSNNGGTIAPTFKQGLSLSQSAIATPTNDYNQKRAVLDGVGTSSTAVTNAEMNASLRNAAGTAYSTSGQTSGVYLPYSIDSNGNKTFTGGGILVEGDASVTLSASGSATEVYTITQGTTTTTVTINNSTNVTTIQVGSGATTTISGVPTVTTGTGATATTAKGAMLYVDGNITSISGTVQDSTALTVTAAQNITVTNDILYKTEPVTTSASGSTPVASLISNADNGQTLGLFTANGAVILKPTKSTLEIDASIVTTSTADTNSSCSLTYICAGTISMANGYSVNTLTIVGGRIQNKAQTFPAGTIGTRNIIFDRRYAGGGFAPPFFPSTTISTAQAGMSYPDGGNTSSSYSRLRWTAKMSY